MVNRPAVNIFLFLHLCILAKWFFLLFFFFLRLEELFFHVISLNMNMNFQVHVSCKPIQPGVARIF